ncbi:MAG: thioredoxin family protein [Chloroflexi bacterium]|nr:thioredoxin family protein [Chloroflexota bacterium]
MTERLIVILIVFIGLFLAQRALAWLLQHQQEKLAQSGPDLVLQGLGFDGRATVLYFWGENCYTCHTRQKPALESLKQRLGDTAQIMPVDAYEAPEAASAFQVMTLPTTVVLNAKGQVAAINHGFANAERLLQQLQSAGVAVPA